MLLGIKYRTPEIPTQFRIVTWRISTSKILFYFSPLVTSDWISFLICIKRMKISNFSFKSHFSSNIHILFRVFKEIITNKRMLRYVLNLVTLLIVEQKTSIIFCSSFVLSKFYLQQFKSGIWCFNDSTISIFSPLKKKYCFFSNKNNISCLFCRFIFYGFWYLFDTSLPWLCFCNLDNWLDNWFLCIFYR